MGCTNSKNKFNKEGEKQRICKIGLSFGRNDLKVEGNFQAGYHSKTDKKYEAVGYHSKTDTSYEAVDGKPLAVLPEIHEDEEQEEGN